MGEVAPSFDIVGYYFQVSFNVLKILGVGPKKCGKMSPSPKWGQVAPSL